MRTSDINIVFRGLDHSDAVEDRIREEAAKLEKAFERIASATVTVEAPHRHQRQGRQFSVHIRLTAPGMEEIVVSQEPGRAEAHEDVYRTIRDAFAAARRQLKDKSERLRGRVKSHDAPAAVAAGSSTV